MSENNPDSPAPSLAKSDQNLVWIDCEMTGLDPEVERLIEIAVVITGPQLHPRIEGPVLVVHQSDTLLDRMDWSEFKRRQAPPSIKISSKAFGVGRRMPIAKAGWRVRAGL